MGIFFKNYEKEDFGNLMECMEGLQDYIVDLDSLKILRKAQNYGKEYREF